MSKKYEYHNVLLVAFDVRGRTQHLVKKHLIKLLPQNVIGFVNDHAEFELDSWWIADDILGTSDCDSAVFVAKGQQEEARRLLLEHGIANH